MKKIEFYFDFLSPYSYLAWIWVRKQPYDFEFYPVSVASIVAHFDTKGPAQIAPKRNYLFKDLLRYSKLNEVNFTTPKSLPFNSLYALRLALKEVAADQQKAIIDAIFMAGWSEGEEIGSDDSLKVILKKKGLYSDELFARMEDMQARVALKSNIERALNKELFGVPSFIIDDEIFWGNDSTKYLEMYINGSDPLDKNKYQQFLDQFKPR
jgi:2-hydroxychromene-2-carboxylate isomerase